MKRRWLSAVAIACFVVLAPGPGSRVQPADALTCGVDQACYTFTVSLFGNGSGSLKSTNSSYVPDGRIDCEYLDGAVVAGSTCSHTYVTPSFSGVTVHYVVTAAAGSSTCEADITNCGRGTLHGSITITADWTESGEGFLLDTETLTVTRTGVGTGSVTSAPAGISCGSACSVGFNYGSTVTLKAAPDAGAAFTTWTGACSGQGSTCSLSMTTSRSTNAVFGLQSATPPPTASPRPTSTPHPTPTSSSQKSPAPSSSAAGRLTTAPPPGAGPSSPATVEGSATPAASIGPGALPTASPSASGLPGVAVVSTGAPFDLTPIVLAILGMGLLIAIGIGFAGFEIRRRDRRS